MEVLSFSKAACFKFAACEISDHLPDDFDETLIWKEQKSERPAAEKDLKDHRQRGAPTPPRDVQCLKVVLLFCMILHYFLKQYQSKSGIQKKNFEKI